MRYSLTRMPVLPLHQVGDVVTLREDLAVGTSYREAYCSASLAEYLGKDFIVNVISDGPDEYCVEYAVTPCGSDQLFWIDETMLVQADEEPPMDTISVEFVKDCYRAIGLPRCHTKFFELDAGKPLSADPLGAIYLAFNGTDKQVSHREAKKFLSMFYDKSYLRGFAAGYDNEEGDGYEHIDRSRFIHGKKDGREVRRALEWQELSRNSIIYAC